MTNDKLADEIEWLHKFISCVPFGADAPQADITRAHDIVDALCAERPQSGEMVMVLNAAAAFLVNNNKPTLASDCRVCAKVIEELLLAAAKAEREKP